MWVCFASALESDWCSFSLDPGPPGAERAVSAWALISSTRTVSLPSFQFRPPSPPRAHRFFPRLPIPPAIYVCLSKIRSHTRSLGPSRARVFAPARRRENCLGNGVLKRPANAFSPARRRTSSFSSRCAIWATRSNSWAVVRLHTTNSGPRSDFILGSC